MLRHGKRSGLSFHKEMFRLTLTQDVFWYTIGIADVVTEVIFIALPMWVVWGLQMDWRKKCIVICAFAFRLT